METHLFLDRRFGQLANALSPSSCFQLREDACTKGKLDSIRGKIDGIERRLSFGRNWVSCRVLSLKFNDDEKKIEKEREREKIYWDIFFIKKKKFRKSRIEGMEFFLEFLSEFFLFVEHWIFSI